jgi:hypothetical protein
VSRSTESRNTSPWSNEPSAGLGRNSLGPGADGVSLETGESGEAPQPEMKITNNKADRRMGFMIDPFLIE